MNEFLSSIKSDLLSRRLLPYIALLGVGLIAAVAYVATSGGSSPAPASQSSPTAAGTSANTVPVSVASANPNAAVSETPGGSRYQNRGSARNPFAPLPETAAEKSKESSSSGNATSAPSNSSSSGSSSSGSSSPGGSGSPSGSSGGTGAGEKPSTQAPSKTSQPAKQEFPYSVSVKLGVVPTTPGQSTTFTAYKNLKPGQRLPSKTDTRISFERVSTSGTSAVFKLDVPPILHGPGRCLPSASECQAIALKAGQVEVLEYVEANGQIAAYELKVSSVTKRHEGASTARVKAKASAAHTALRAREALAQPRAGIALASHIEHPAPANNK